MLAIFFKVKTSIKDNCFKDAVTWVIDCFSLIVFQRIFVVFFSRGGDVLWAALFSEKGGWIKDDAFK